MKKNLLKKLHTALAALLAGVALVGFSGCAELMGSFGDILQDAAGVDNETAYVDPSYVFQRTLGGGDYYYQRLTESQQRFYKKIHIDMDKLFSGSRELKTYTSQGEQYYILGNYECTRFGLTETQALQAFDAFYQDCPQYYAYDGVYMLYGDGVISPVIAKEYASKAARDAADGKVEAAVEAVRLQIGQGYSDYDIFTVIYDYVVGRTEYEYVGGRPSMNAHAGNIVGVLDGVSSTNSVCVGYTFAITYLCNIFGVECISVGNETLNHAWNVVKMDGKWYHVDATNNDGNNMESLALCSEEVFWRFFEYATPQYDVGEADTVSRVGILPDVSDRLGYDARLLYQECGDGYAVTAPKVMQSVLRAPSTHLGRPVVRWAATNVAGLEILILPVSVKELSLSFGSETKLFYEGTAEQLKQLSVSAWNMLTYMNMEKYFYSEEEPTSDGNFWHYDGEGNAVVWQGVA